MLPLHRYYYVIKLRSNTCWPTPVQWELKPFASGVAGLKNVIPRYDEKWKALLFAMLSYSFVYRGMLDVFKTFTPRGALSSVSQHDLTVYICSLGGMWYVCSNIIIATFQQVCPYCGNRWGAQLCVRVWRMLWILWTTNTCVINVKQICSAFSSYTTEVSGCS